MDNDNNIEMSSENNDVLTNHEINRYSRQIILPDIGIKGQLALCNASVLIVGAGGLGCPCAMYLAGAGIGHIGLVDYDEVELNNLHRQVLHTEKSLGEKKVTSASSALIALNSNIKITPFHTELNSETAMDIISQFNIVVDATDNVASRYLLNDVCYFAGKPLVSGSALQMEGQLTVYHYGEGPCYRCLFPLPPPPAAVINCGEGGVLGVVPGTVGVLQALQVCNIILKRPTLAGSLLLFDGVDCTFRKVKLRCRSKTCALCGEQPTITALIDYEQFCSSKANDKNPKLNLLPEDQRITPREYRKLMNDPHTLIDVRSSQEFGICQLPNSINIPMPTLQSAKAIELIKCHISLLQSSTPIYVICRRGNDSQKAVLKLNEVIGGRTIKDVKDGLHGWARDVDSDFPIY